MKHRIVVLAFIISALLSSCGQERTLGSDQRLRDSSSLDKAPLQPVKRAKFEPKDGEVILFVGQELDAIGGIDQYANGYFDHFETPGGFTMYTDIMPGLTETFLQHSFTYTGLNGIWQTDDWGDGPNNMSLQLADPDFQHSALAIGLAMIDNEDKIAEGERDKYIERMGEFFLSLGRRPVFLRIGFEFGGEWNRYEKTAYIKAFRRIKDRLDAQGVNNVAYVWQSKGFGHSLESLATWYPGDEYVDWLGYSFFSHHDKAVMIEYAKQKGKPVFIAEATPTATDWKNDPQGNTGLTKEYILSNPEQAKMAWEEWFIPFFATIDSNPAHVKAISYINANWRAKPRWKVNNTFKNIDARIQLSEYISRKWREQVRQPKYLHASEDLFEYLWSGGN